MNRLLLLLLLLAGLNGIGAQNCPNMDSPAPIADSCGLAPFFCGNYLADYCSSNYDLTDDDFGLSSGFLRLSPCDQKIALEISVYDCVDGDSALIFSLYNEGCDSSNALSTLTVAQGVTDTFTASNLLVLENYQLAVSGAQGSQCRFNLKVIDGIGTAEPGPVVCQCDSDSISGPKTVCTIDPITYTIVSGPNCFFSFGAPVGGNGLYCPPPGACSGTFDSLVVQWHIPPMFKFIGDSTGMAVKIAVNTSYMGLDTIRNDSIYASWSFLSTTPVDTLVFCKCAIVDCGNNGSVSIPIRIGHQTDHYNCTLTCEQPTCTILGITYDTPGTYSYVTMDCHEIEVTITEDFDPPVVTSQVICQGESTVLVVANPDPDYSYTWSTGQTGTSISVAPGTSTSYEVTATHVSGNCTFTGTGTVTVIIPAQINLGQVATITCAQPCVTYNGTVYCQPGTYSIESPICTTKVFVIGNDPSITQDVLPTVTICEGDCYQFFDQSICSSGTYSHIENCVNYIQQLNVEPVGTLDLGIIGSVGCAQPCLTYDGITYCNPGIYTVQTLCGAKKFEIVFEKQIIQSGEVGKITCQQPCVTYNGTTYCLPGDYVDADSCSERHFSIGENLSEPQYTTPFLDCLPSNTQFTVAFVINGLPPYKINGTTLVGNYFLSGPQDNGVPYLFVIEQANGCQTLVSGKYDCAQFCTTDAGKLSADTLHGCIGQSTVQAETTVLPLLAPGDVSIYTLETATGAVLAQNTTGEFDFDPVQMSPEVVYYAIFNAGPPDAAGFPDAGNACTDTSTHQPVVFHELPEVSVSGDSLICEGAELRLRAEGASHYRWNTGWTGSEFLILKTQTDDSDTYWVIGATDAGCNSMDSVSVEVRPAESAGCCKLQLPNAFTPNGDGANDGFAPIFPDCSTVQFVEMRIYSRWGELVFESRGNDSRWDGLMPGGSPAVSDTYIFTFRYRLEGDEEKTEKGEITLLR